MSFKSIITSRPEPEMEGSLEPILTHGSIPVKGSEVQSDIARYVTHEIENGPWLRTWDDETISEIRSALV
jgi:hypothetical protein